MQKVSRNEPCPCGSGKKYKNCHQNIESTTPNKNLTFVITAVIVVFIVLAGIGLFLGSGNNETTAKPEGPAPAGKVWSEEHQHYH